MPIDFRQFVPQQHPGNMGSTSLFRLADVMLQLRNQNMAAKQNAAQRASAEAMAREGNQAEIARSAASDAQRAAEAQGQLAQHDRDKRIAAAEKLSGAVASGQSQQMEALGPFLEASGLRLAPETRAQPALDAVAASLGAGMGMAGNPAAGHALGAMGALPTGSTQTPTGRYMVSGAPGEEFGPIDLNRLDEQRRAALKPSLDALADGSNAWDRPARQTAAAVALETPGAGPEEAQKLQTDIANPQLQRETARANAAAMQAGTAQRSSTNTGLREQGLELQRVKYESQQQARWATPHMSEYKNALNAYTEARNALTAIATGTAIGEVAAVNGIIKSFQGSHPSDYDARSFKDAGGVEVSWENALNRWVGGGHMSPKFLRDLTTLLQKIRNDAQIRRKDAVQKTRAGILSDTGIRAERRKELADGSEAALTGLLANEGAPGPNYSGGEGGEGSLSESESSSSSFGASGVAVPGVGPEDDDALFRELGLE